MVLSPARRAWRSWTALPRRERDFACAVVFATLLIVDAATGLPLAVFGLVLVILVFLAGPL